MQVERTASARTDKPEEEPALGKLGKFSITLIFLLVMSTELERDKHGWGAGWEGGQEMPGAVSSEELAGWRSEESWGDRSREAGSGAGCPGGRASRQPGGEAGERPLRVRWLQMGDRSRRQAAGPQAWDHTDLPLPSFCLVGRFLLQDHSLESISWVFLSAAWLSLSC